MKTNFNQKDVRQSVLSFDDYKNLKNGLKKPLSNKAALYRITKGCFVVGLPLLTAGNLQAQCQTVGAVNAVVPDAENEGGGSNNGLGIDVDGDGNDDFLFFESPNGNGKIRRITGGSMSVVGTGGPYAVQSAQNFAENAVIPGGKPGVTLAYFDYPGGGQWPVSANGSSATGFMGIKKGNNYGFLELTISIAGPNYVVSIPDAAEPISESSIMAGECPAALPVSFVSFFVEGKGNDVKLHWVTASEQDNAGFELQRSDDGAAFVTIGWVDGNGSTTERRSYDYTDEGLSAGTQYYYRLKQVDFGGESSFSPTVSAFVEGEVIKAGNFYPNPVTSDLVNINVNTIEAEEWITAVYDAKGSVVQNQVFRLNEGDNKVELNMQGILPGTYFVKFDSGRERFYKTLIIK